MTVVPLMLPLVNTAPVRVLLVKLAAPSSVTTTPALGNVAVEERPIPPKVVGKMPVTAAGCDRSMALNEGVAPSCGTVKL